MRLFLSELGLNQFRINFGAIKRITNFKLYDQPQNVVSLKINEQETHSLQYIPKV